MVDNDGQHGLRITSLGDGRAVFRQTVLREAAPAPGRRYVDAMNESGDQIERFVDLSCDKAVADAVRAALSGEL